MLKSFFTDKGNFSKKAYKDYFNFNAKRLNIDFEIKSVRYDKGRKTLFVDIVKKLYLVKTNSVCFPTGIVGKTLTQFVNLNLNLFILTYTVSLEDLKNEQKVLDFYNRNYFKNEN